MKNLKKMIVAMVVGFMVQLLGLFLIHASPFCRSPAVAVYSSLTGWVILPVPHLLVTQWIMSETLLVEPSSGRC